MNNLFDQTNWADEYLSVQKFKKSLSVYKFEQRIKHTQKFPPLRPLKKIPFEQKVIDSRNDVFMYLFRNNKLIYIYLYSLYEPI